LIWDCIHPVILSTATGCPARNHVFPIGSNKSHVVTSRIVLGSGFFGLSFAMGGAADVLDPSAALVVPAALIHLSLDND
jgi:hypothetical protein